MTGPQVSYVGSARDGRCIRVMVHDLVVRLTSSGPEQLRLKLGGVVDEARKQAGQVVPLSDVYSGKVIDFPGGES